MSKYSGTWYLIEGTYAEFLKGGKCIEVNHFKNPNGTLSIDINQINIQYDKIHICNSGKFINLFDFRTGKKSITKAYGEVVGPNGEADVLLDFYGTKFLGSLIDILETDYKTYSVCWGCQKIDDDNNAEVIWILSRDRNPSQELISKCHDV
ncbi:hypothetical protein HHI36_000831 [Cryptolaemus montrouzieri]|uniref:Lipocalin/cytosolic fatty-acid binding domain-containing protein n=1 Tax=Cryptolaemus montrouzieri TaxID=559131 RepID=A0ABD2P6M4_9CUCU